MLDRVSSKSNHLAGWTAVVTPEEPEAIRAEIGCALTSFVGDYGPERVIDVVDGLGFGLLRPERPLPMTTWSYSRGERSVCFVEGVFYDDFGSNRIRQGEDAGLARALAAAIETEGAEAVGRLNGSFSGFLFDRRQRSLSTFVDRLGTKILYWSNESDRVFVASNLAAFRSRGPLRLDFRSAFEFLTVGFPIADRTLLADVRVQLPCSWMTFSRGRVSAGRYLAIPERRSRLSIPDAVTGIVEAMEDAVVRISGRLGQPLGLGLTGGHDSRVIFSSLLHTRVPFEALRWRDYNFNDRIAQRLCTLSGRKVHVAPAPSDEDLLKIQRDAFVYSDGQQLHSYGFTWLARECAAESLGALSVGFSGDVLSHSPALPSPRRVLTVSRLARGALLNQMEILDFKNARQVLRGTHPDIGRETRQEWINSFQTEAWRGSIPDIALWQEVNNRGLKRVRSAMIAGLQYAQMIFPFLDNRVMETYLRLPIEYLDQRPHCLAGFFRFPKFGAYPACGYPIPLKDESRWKPAIGASRVALNAFRRTRRRLLREPDRRHWDLPSHAVYEEVLRFPIFDSKRIADLVRQRRIKLIDLRKMQNLSRFHDFYIAGDGSFIPPRYLSR